MLKVKKLNCVNKRKTLFISCKFWSIFEIHGVTARIQITMVIRPKKGKMFTTALV